MGQPSMSQTSPVVTLTISIFLGGILVMHLKENYCVPDPLGGPEPAAGCTEAG